MKYDGVRSTLHVHDVVRKHHGGMASFFVSIKSFVFSLIAVQVGKVPKHFWECVHEYFTVHAHSESYELQH